MWLKEFVWVVLLTMNVGPVDSIFIIFGLYFITATTSILRHTSVHVYLRPSKHRSNLYLTKHSLHNLFCLIKLYPTPRLCGLTPNSMQYHALTVC